MIPSYHDLNNENSYHIMMLGMCLCLSDNYKVIYNREEVKEDVISLSRLMMKRKHCLLLNLSISKKIKNFEKALINYQ